MADEPGAPAAAPAQKESASDSLRRGLYILAFVAMPVGGMAVSAARLFAILRLMDTTDLNYEALSLLWGAWACGTAIILLAGSGKDAVTAVRAIVVGIGVMILLLMGSF